MNKTILLIPHYNNVSGLKVSLESIGPAEKTDVIIVDDGSNIPFDKDEISKSFLANGTVHAIYSGKNEGIEFALNKGLEFALAHNYEYVARLDCGDINKANRLRIQEEFLEKHNEIAFIGSNVRFVDTKGQHLFNLIFPQAAANIRKKMFVNAMFCHPTIFFRTAILSITGLYPTNYKAAEDYAFFFKVIQNFKTANINEVLVVSEINPQGISYKHRKIQAKNRIKIIYKNFYFGMYPIYGLLRSVLLYLIPIKWLTFLKRTLKK